MLEFQIATLAVLILLSALFSGTETALMSLTMFKVNALLKQKRRGSAALHRIKQNPHKLIITILIGNNLVNIGAASLATVLFIDLFGSKGVGIATGIMTFLILVFGEITPKTYATNNAERMSLVAATPIEALSYILTPIVVFFELIAKFMSWLLRSKEEKELSEDELRSIVTMGKREGILTREAAEMMHNVLEFKGTKVTEIMTPKIDVQMIDGNSKLKDILDFVVKSHYSRFPVYLKDKENIKGLLDVDDILRCAKSNRLNNKVKTVMRKAYFVPESKEIDDLLTEFEGRHIPLAIIVNEYGYLTGMVTIEDILEEIVGDIFDKSKRRSAYIKRINDKVVRVDAKISVEELNRTLHLGLREAHFDTIAGFIQHKLHRIPRKGEKIKLKKVTIEIADATSKRIKSVKIIKS
jgi:Mg2+/Co2+ transporter CorB